MTTISTLSIVGALAVLLLVLSGVLLRVKKEPYRPVTLPLHRYLSPAGFSDHDSPTTA